MPSHRKPPGWVAGRGSKGDMCAGVRILQGRTGEAGGPDDRLASQLRGVGLPEWSGPWPQGDQSRCTLVQGFPRGSAVKNPPASAGDTGSIPAGKRSRRSKGPPAAAATKSLQSCPTLCDPIDGSPPGSPVPGILQARTLEWVAISFSKACK